jgi:hypothetical protein
MLHPVGRLPENVYWRRRVVLVVAALLTIILVKYVLFSGGDSNAATRPPGPRVASLSSPTTAATRTAIKPTPVPRKTLTKKKTAKTISNCSTKSLTLFVGTIAESYKVGTISHLALSVANMSNATCRVDLGPRIQNALVYRGATRLWASTDCHPAGASDVVTMKPGELRRLVIGWSGRTARPGCSGRHVQVDPGRYRVVAEVGKLRGSGTVVLRG